MSGYFSQLARHTGLSFGPVAPAVASSVATEPTVAVRGSYGAPQVEEVIFTAAPAPGGADVTGEAPAGAPSVRSNSPLDRDDGAVAATDGWRPQQTPAGDNDDRPPDVAATSKRFIEGPPGTSPQHPRLTVTAFTDSDSRSRHSREQPAEEERWGEGPDELSRAERQRDPEESVEIPVIVESPIAGHVGSALVARSRDSEVQEPDRIAIRTASR